MEIINISRLVTRYKSNKKNRNECVAVSITVWLLMLHNVLLYLFIYVPKQDNILGHLIKQKKILEVRPYLFKNPYFHMKLNGFKNSRDLFFVVG